jgi:hypothetical protein
MRQIVKVPCGYGHSYLSYQKWVPLEKVWWNMGTWDGGYWEVITEEAYYG